MENQKKKSPTSATCNYMQLTFDLFYRRPCHHNIALYRNRLASALLAPLWQSGCVWSELREADSTTRQCEGYSWASARSFDTGVFVSLLVYFSICVLLYLCICTTQQCGTVGYSYGSAESFDILRFSIPHRALHHLTCKLWSWWWSNAWLVSPSSSYTVLGIIMRVFCF